MPRAGRAEIVPCSNASPTASPREASGRRTERGEGLHVGEPSGEAVGVDDAPDRGPDGHGAMQVRGSPRRICPAADEIITSTPQSGAATPRNMIVCPDTASIARMRALATLSFDDEPGEQGRRRRSRRLPARVPTPPGSASAAPSSPRPIDASLGTCFLPRSPGRTPSDPAGSTRRTRNDEGAHAERDRAPTKHATPISKPVQLGEQVVRTTLVDEPRASGSSPISGDAARPRPRPRRRRRPPLPDECASSRRTPPHTTFGFAGQAGSSIV